MAKKMPSELFEQQKTMQFVNTVNVPITLYQQEYDWTCSIACLRSMMFALSPKNVDKGDRHFIETYGLTPKPYYSKDFKEKMVIESELLPGGELNSCSILYGCDNPVSFDDMIDYLRKGYFVAIRYVYNHHWCLVLGFFNRKASSFLEDCQVLLYDPHLSRLQLENAATVEKMWRFPRLLKTGEEEEAPSWYFESPEDAEADYIAIGRKVLE